MAILVKDGIFTKNIRLPSGRGIAATINGIWYVNVYAPSGTERKNEREEFFNRHLPTLLPTTPVEVVLAGDFNSIIDSRDTTPHSTTLRRLISTLNLRDVWDIATAPRGFTHYTYHAVSRIDRIYTTVQLFERKQCVRAIVAPFTS